MYLFLPFAGEQEIVPSGFQGCSAETDEYSLQDRGPQDGSVQTMQQDVKWDFPCGPQLVAKVKRWGQKRVKHPDAEDLGMEGHLRVCEEFHIVLCR